MPVAGKKERGADPDDPAADHNDIRRREGGRALGDGGGGIIGNGLHGQASCSWRWLSRAAPGRGSGAQPPAPQGGPSPGIWYHLEEEGRCGGRPGGSFQTVQAGRA